MKKYMAGFIMISLFAPLSSLADVVNHGVINFKGYIYETPCLFDMDFENENLLTECYNKGVGKTKKEWSIVSLNVNQIKKEPVDMYEYIISKNVLSKNDQNIIVSYK